MRPFKGYGTQVTVKAYKPFIKMPAGKEPLFVLYLKAIDWHGTLYWFVLMKHFKIIWIFTSFGVARSHFVLYIHYVNKFNNADYTIQ